jgi:hypothetical protein
MAKSGRYFDMETKARELANADPNSGFALKALSVSLQLQGKEALQFLERAALLLAGRSRSRQTLPRYTITSAMP